MTSRQSSIKGRGTEVLLGTPRAVGSSPEEPTSSPSRPDAPEAGALPLPADAQPETGISAPAPTPALVEAPSLTETELQAALYDEACAAEDEPAGGDAPWLAASAWPPAPEVEAALIEHDRQLNEAAVRPSQPLTVTTVAKSEGSGGQIMGVSAAAEEPVYYEMLDESVDDADIQSPGGTVDRLELPERVLTEQERKDLTAEASARITKLNADIDRLYAQILTEVGDSEVIATQCYNDLLKARDIVLRRDVAKLAQAEYYVEQARARLQRAVSSGTGARKNAWWIFAWGLLWAFGLVTGLILMGTPAVLTAIERLDLSSPYVDPKILLPAMMWGGVGAVVAVWYSLFKHIAARDFDGNYNISYIGKPFFGLVLGATVYMMVNLLLVSLGVMPSNVAEGAVAITPRLAPWVVYLVAWATGFKENRVFGLVDQVLKRLFPDK
jgi:hypothetical protein